MSDIGPSSRAQKPSFALSAIRSSTASGSTDAPSARTTCPTARPSASTSRRSSPLSFLSVFLALGRSWAPSSPSQSIQGKHRRKTQAMTRGSVGRWDGVRRVSEGRHRRTRFRTASPGTRTRTAMDNSHTPMRTCFHAANGFQKLCRELCRTNASCPTPL
jgi:hypothetical protein